jgi:hypothetical protein
MSQTARGLDMCRRLTTTIKSGRFRKNSELKAWPDATTRIDPVDGSWIKESMEVLNGGLQRGSGCRHLADGRPTAAQRDGPDFLFRQRKS